MSLQNRGGQDWSAMLWRAPLVISVLGLGLVFRMPLAGSTEPHETPAGAQVADALAEEAKEEEHEQEQLSPPLSNAAMPQEELEQPATTVEEWIAQIAQSLVQITRVRLETAQGFQIVLATTEGELSTPTTQTLGNAVIADIPNAVLALPDGGEFQQTNSTEGIALVSVTSLPGDRVRVSVTGSDAPPTAEVRAEARGLVLSVVPGAGAASAADELQVVVTATRTEEEIQNVPRSVTVITQEEIADQARLDRNLADILARLVPGFGPPTGRTNTFGQTLRGRDISVLIDGVPQNTNLGSIPAQLTTIDPQAIERIEVVRGPNAIYGGQATGGVVNIITRRPTDETLRQTVEIGAAAAAGGEDRFLTGDSFSYNFLYSLSGRAGAVDWLGSLSFVPTGSFYDADGDRIPSDLVNADLDEINGLVRLGVDFDEDQRLEFTFNHFDQSQDADFVSDPEIDTIPGVQKARAIRIAEGTEIIGAPDEANLTTTNLTLQYSGFQLSLVHLEESINLSQR